MFSLTGLGGSQDITSWTSVAGLSGEVLLLHMQNVTLRGPLLFLVFSPRSILSQVHLWKCFGPRLPWHGETKIRKGITQCFLLCDSGLCHTHWTQCCPERLVVDPRAGVGIQQIRKQALREVPGTQVSSQIALCKVMAMIKTVTPANACWALWARCCSI